MSESCTERASPVAWVVHFDRAVHRFGNTPKFICTCPCCGAERAVLEHLITRRARLKCLVCNHVGVPNQTNVIAKDLGNPGFALGEFEKFVYVFRDEERSMFKVGVSENHPGYRLKTINTQGALNATLDRVFIGSGRVEKFLHELLAHFRVKGEWFQDCEASRFVLENGVKLENLTELTVKQIDAWARRRKVS